MPTVVAAEVASDDEECFKCNLWKEHHELIELVYPSELNELVLSRNNFCDLCVEKSMDTYKYYLLREVEDFSDAYFTDVVVRINRAMMREHTKRLAKSAQEKEEEDLLNTARQANTTYTYLSQEERTARVMQISDDLYWKIIDEVRAARADEL